MKKGMCYVLVPALAVLLLSGCRTTNPLVSQTAAASPKEESSQPQVSPSEAETQKEEETKESEKIIKGDPDRFPEIRVTWGEAGDEIPSAAGSVQWIKKGDNGEDSSVIACGAEPLSYLMHENADAPYIALEHAITIEFLNAPAPDRITMTDRILNENGSPKYGDNAVISQELTCEGQHTSFMLNTNFNAMLSSDLATYQKGGVLRGFTLECSWENGGSADFGFVVRTDAACGVEDHSAEVYPMSLCGTGIDVFAGIDEIKKKGDDLQLKVTLSNQTGEEFIFGEEPRLYRYEGETAVEMKVRSGAGWNDIANRLKPHKNADFTVDLGALYGELQTGYYSFQKVLTNTVTGEDQTVSVQFTVADE